MPTTRLLEVTAPAGALATVLVLHGGGSRPGSPVVSPAQLSVLRMKPLAARIAHRGRGRLAVFRVLNSHRGWDPRFTPVDDVVQALADLDPGLRDLPVGLVGHSLGGRAALLAGSERGVRSVVALNPWLSADDDPRLSDRRVLVVHGDQDRIAPIARSRALVSRLADRVDIRLVTVSGGKHAMLRHGRTFESRSADFLHDTLLGQRR